MKTCSLPCSLSTLPSLAGSLANALSERQLRTIFFSGPLGSGKTTCIRFLVRALPGSETAEVSSPTFSICNYYSVTPPLVHCDLYRVRNAVPDEVFDALENPRYAVLLEWPEYLPREFWPDDLLLVSLAPLATEETPDPTEETPDPADSLRSFGMTAFGSAAERVLGDIAARHRLPGHLP